MNRVPIGLGKRRLLDLDRRARNALIGSLLRQIELFPDRGRRLVLVFCYPWPVDLLEIFL